MTNMRAPLAGFEVIARSGTLYTADANGFVQNVATSDVHDLISAVCIFSSSTPAQSLSTGLRVSNPLSLLYARNVDGSALAAAASAGKFGASITLGTAAFLVSEAANSNTKTDDCLFEYVMPSEYASGTNFPVAVNASIVGSGTLSTKTVQVRAYRVGNDGTMGADIGPGAASAMTASGADVSFTIAGATLHPGDRVLFEVETVLTETAGSNMTAHVNSVRVG